MSDDWYVYILGCNDGSFYTGVTCDLFRRLEEHNSPRGGCRYTRSRKPVKLLASWQVPEQGAALQAEYYIKHHLHRRQKEVLIANPLELLVLLPDFNLQPYWLET